MHPRQIHFICDFCLFVPLLGIFLSTFFSPSTFDSDIFIVKDLFESWKNKPVHILQDSYHKTCKEMGMNDIISYPWPGTSQGCLCENGSRLTQGKCSDFQLKSHCKNVDPTLPLNGKRWKGQYLCTSSIKSKSYFELSKIKTNDICSYKTKKCGIIDTLNNYLCVPENENCPLNTIQFLSNEDNSVRIDTGNKNYEGKIYSNFKVAEGQLCLSHNQREFQEKDYPLLIKNEHLLSRCVSSAVWENGTVFFNNPHFKVLDSYSKKIFYDHNGITSTIKFLPLYPNVTSTMSLYASVFTGWKRECEKKEFTVYMNNRTDSEVNAIISSTKDNSLLLYFYTGILTLLFVCGIIYLKYSQILTAGYKVEITSSAMIIVCSIYILICIFCGLLIYIAEINLDVIKNAKISNDFFELISNNECSDAKTNIILKHVASEYFCYANRYFNIKMLSIITIGVCFMIMFYTLFTKHSNDRKLAKKQNKFSLIKFD